MLTQAVPALLVVTALAGLTGWLVAGRILRPIRTIAGTANRLSAENLSERIPVPRPADELAVLAATINGMLDRIQRGITERDRVLNSQLLRVVNTGPLVTPEEGRRLFEPFVRCAGNGTRGAGLGLSVVLAVVTAHDGEISSIIRPTGVEAALRAWLYNGPRPAPEVIGAWRCMLARRGNVSINAFRRSASRPSRRWGYGAGSRMTTGISRVVFCS